MKISKTGIVLVASALICVILALAVGIPNGFFGDGGKGGDLDDENTPDIEDIMDGGTPLMVFDKSEQCTKLMDAFDKGQIISVKIQYDMDGANAEIITNDPDDIRKVYKGLKNIVVGEKTDKSVTDSDHHVIFVLADGSETGYYFEGDSILVYQGDSDKDKGNYEISGSEQLWDVYRSLAGGN